MTAGRRPRIAACLRVVPARWRDEAGLLGGVDALAFGTLIFITGTLLVLNAWSVVDTRMAVSAAAREAVRTVVEAPADRLSLAPAGAEHGGTRLDHLTADAIDRAVVAMQQHGKTVEDGSLVVEFQPLGADLRCAVVAVRVTYDAPTIGLPFVGIFRDGIGVTIEHAERIDPFRAGLSGEASCV